MRKALVAAISMSVFLGAATPSFAQTVEPARASSALAYGISGAGLLPISPTPVVNVAQPPDTGQQLGSNFNSTIPLDLGGIAVNATINAVGEAARDPRIASALDNPDGVSARGFARTEGLSLLGENNLLQALGLPLDAPALLTASAIEAEAVAACVDGEAAFSTDSNIIGLTLAELDLGSELLDPLLRQLLETLNLPGILEIAQDESGILPDGSGVFVNALRITVLGTLQTLIIGHAEARMPDDCRVPPVAPPPTAGPGGGGALAATGAELPFLPLGLAVVSFGVILNRVVRRANRRTTIG